MTLNHPTDQLEIVWSYMFCLPSGRIQRGDSTSVGGLDSDEATRHAFRNLTVQLEGVAVQHGIALSTSSVRTALPAFAFGGGITESVVQILGAVGGVAGIAGLLKDFLPIIRDWKKSNRNLSVTLKRNGIELSVIGAQSADEASALLKTSVTLATKKLPVPSGVTPTA